MEIITIHNTQPEISYKVSTRKTFSRTKFYPNQASLFGDVDARPKETRNRGAESM